MSGQHLQYRLLVFDWDGTLIDSIATIVSCTQATLLELGLVAAEEHAIRASIGLGIRETVEGFFPGCDDGTFQQIVDVYRRLWFESYSRRSVLFPGARETVEKFARQERLLAVATAKSRKGLATDLERTGMSDVFHATRTADEAPSKPNPHMLFELLDELGARPAETLMVGDSVHDLQMAANAGVRGVGVASGSTSKDLLCAEGASCLEDVTELAGWLRRVEASGEVSATGSST